MPVTLTGTVEELKVIIAKIDGNAIAEPKPEPTNSKPEPEAVEPESSGRRRRRSRSTEESKPESSDPGLPVFIDKPSRMTQKFLRAHVQRCTDRWGREAIQEFWDEFEVDSVDKLDNKDYADAHNWFVAYDMEKLLDIVSEKRPDSSVTKEFLREFEVDSIDKVKIEDFEEAFKWLTSLYNE